MSYRTNRKTRGKFKIPVEADVRVQKYEDYFADRPSDPEWVERHVRIERILNDDSIDRAFLGIAIKGVIYKGWKAYKFGDRIQLIEPESESVGYGPRQVPPESVISGHRGSTSYASALELLDY